MNTKILKQKVSFVLQGLNQLLWPAVCINCGENICENDNNLCENCWNELLICTSADYCRRCGRDASKYAILEGVCPQCQGEKIYFDQIARSGIYTDALREMLLAFKLKGQTELDLVLGFLAKAALQGSGFENKIDFFVPVPLHWFRRLTRGYNQASLLAKRLKHPTVKINTDLVRFRRTNLQTTMANPSKRAANVKGAFAVRREHDLAGKNVCLIDDIKTTGATLNECAKTLKEAGAAEVFALVLAVVNQNS